MKNILKEKPLPFDQLHGRCKYCCEIVAENDIKDKNVLDIGCGFGWFLLYALTKNPKELSGIEKDLSISPAELIDDSRLLVSHHDARHLPYENQSLDTIVCWDVIEHLPKGSEKEFFKEAARVLKPNGKLYLSTPYSAPLACITDPAWWLIGHRHYSFFQLDKLYDEWFYSNHSEIKGGFWDMLGLLNMYIAKWVFRRQSFFKDFFDKKIDNEYIALQNTFETGFMTLYVVLIKR